MIPLSTPFQVVYSKLAGNQEILDLILRVMPDQAE
jgi:hypothetical protein